MAESPSIAALTAELEESMRQIQQLHAQLATVKDASETQNAAVARARAFVEAQARIHAGLPGTATTSTPTSSLNGGGSPSASGSVSTRSRNRRKRGGGGVGKGINRAAGTPTSGLPAPASHTGISPASGPVQPTISGGADLSPLTESDRVHERVLQARHVDAPRDRTADPQSLPSTPETRQFLATEHYDVDGPGTPEVVDALLSPPNSSRRRKSRRAILERSVSPNNGGEPPRGIAGGPSLSVDTRLGSDRVAETFSRSRTAEMSNGLGESVHGDGGAGSIALSREEADQSFCSSSMEGQLSSAIGDIGERHDRPDDGADFSVDGVLNDALFPDLHDQSGLLSDSSSHDTSEGEADDDSSMTYEQIDLELFRKRQEAALLYPTENISPTQYCLAFCSIFFLMLVMLNLATLVYTGKPFYLVSYALHRAYDVYVTGWPSIEQFLGPSLSGWVDWAFDSAFGWLEGVDPRV